MKHIILLLIAGLVFAGCGLDPNLFPDPPKEEAPPKALNWGDANWGDANWQ